MAVTFLDLVTNSVIFSTTVDMTCVLREMAAEGSSVRPQDLAVISPQRRANILRFGDYDTERLHIPPTAYDPRPRSPARLTGAVPGAQEEVAVFWVRVKWTNSAGRTAARPMSQTTVPAAMVSGRLFDWSQIT